MPTDFKGWLLEVLEDLKQEAQEVQGITKLYEARLSEQRKAGGEAKFEDNYYVAIDMAKIWWLSQLP